MANLTPKDLAKELGTDPKTVRKFLRSLTADRAGKGGRWAIDSADVPELARRFADWRMVKATKFVLVIDEDSDTES